MYFGFADESYAVYWDEVTGDFGEVGRALCEADGYEIFTDDETNVQCNSGSFEYSWSTFEGFDSGNTAVTGRRYISE